MVFKSEVQIGLKKRDDGLYFLVGEAEKVILGLLHLISMKQSFTTSW